MNRTLARLFPVCAIQLAVINYCTAQNKSPQSTLQPPPAGVIIDGDLKEWGDSLRYYNEDQKLYYTLANDKENLYMAIRINDRSEQMRVLGAGLTLSIDTRGKKKETFSVTFPIGGSPAMAPDGDNQPLTGGAPDQAVHDDHMQANLTKLRQIKVTGFKDVESDLITTSNTYGFKAAIDFDKDGKLVYEAAIPLKLFHDDDLTKNEWAFNFKINGLTRPAQKRGDDENGMQGGGGRGGMGGGGMGGGRGMRGGGRGMRGGGGQGQAVEHSELSKSVDFWTKFSLN
jgi:uncharacterized membrane protein YgcG